MFTIEGKYGKASIYLSDKSELEEASVQQLNDLLNIPYAEGANIAIMPDVHAGVGCVIGYTQSIEGKVIPNLVGVDLNCGMLVRKIAKSFAFDFKTLDKLIRHEIPHGCSHRREPHPYADNVDFTGIFTPAEATILSKLMSMKKATITSSFTRVLGTWALKFANTIKNKHASSVMNVQKPNAKNTSSSHKKTTQPQTISRLKFQIIWHGSKAKPSTITFTMSKSRNSSHTGIAEP